MTAFVRQQNYASVLDLDTMCWFFDCQEINLPPKYTRMLEVDRLSLESDFQSASTKACTKKLVGLLVA